MAINPLKVASVGYLKRQTKAVLIIAVAGYLNFQGTPPPIPTPIPSGGQFVGGGSTHRSSRDSDYIIEDEQRFKIERDDNEILNIVEIFMRCQ